MGTEIGVVGVQVGMVGVEVCCVGFEFVGVGFEFGEVGAAVEMCWSPGGARITRSGPVEAVNARDHSQSVLD